MKAQGRSRAFVLLVVAGTVAGLALIFHSAATSGSSISGSFAEFWVLATLATIGEMSPVKIGKDGTYDEITTSSLFAFTILLRLGTGPAVLALAMASLAADLAQRKAPWKAAFNASLYALSVAAAGFVLSLVTRADGFGGLPHVESMDLPGILISAAVFFLVNNSLAALTIALRQKMAILPFLLHDLGDQASMNGVLLTLAPVAAVAAERSLFLMPLLAVSTTIFYKTASLYAEKEYKSHQALHDSLTALPNRTLFYDRVQQAILEARRTESSLAVMLIDLDRFKEVNDSLGHHIGDALLIRVAERLQGGLRSSDTIARLGGDEFALVLPNIGNRPAATAIAAKITSALENPFFLDEVAGEITLDVEASIGIVLSPEQGGDVDSLLQRADVAMYAAKAARTGYEFYSNEQDFHSPKRLALLGELRKAIDEDELVLHYQPKIEARSGRLVGLEALLRWRHSARGLIYPDEFIPSAERTGLIHPLTRHVLRKALMQWVEWRQQGLELSIAVNVSRQSLLDPNFPNEVAQLLETHSVPASDLELEITESSIMADFEQAKEVLERLSRMGIRLSLDDYGSGYSSLAHIKRLPITEVKIDKSFVLGMARDPGDRVIVRSTIELGHNLGLSVVAEGVESLETLRDLATLGCDRAQGFWVSGPLPGAEVVAWASQFHVPETVVRTMPGSLRDRVSPGSVV